MSKQAVATTVSQDEGEGLGQPQGGCAGGTTDWKHVSAGGGGRGGGAAHDLSVDCRTIRTFGRHTTPGSWSKASRRGPGKSGMGVSASACGSGWQDETLAVKSRRGSING